MATIPASDNEFPEVKFAEGAAPGTPASGLVIAYAKSDGLLYSKDDAGAETALGAAAHIADTADAHDASAVSVDPTGLSVVAGTDVQTAIGELDAGIAGGGIPATIVDAKGDLIAATAADTVARLAVGSNGAVLVAASGQSTGLQWVSLGSASYRRTTGDYTTTSASFVDVDGTNLALTITTGARRVLCVVQGGFESSASSTTVAFDILVDGASVGGGDGLMPHAIPPSTGTGFRWPLQLTFVTEVLSAGSHTFKLQYKTGSGTLTVFGGTGAAKSPLKFSVIEQLV